MPTLYATQGLPASGKSTAAKQWVAQDPGRRVRVNRDDTRRMLHGGYFGTPEQEEQVSMVTLPAIRGLLTAGLDVVVDDTNLNPRTTAQLRRIAAETGSQFEIWDFTGVPVEECIRRDAQRTGDERVGEQVIRGMWRRYLSGRRPSRRTGHRAPATAAV